MTMLAKNSRLRFTMNNQVVDAPIEWEDITINASFDNDSIQANINTDSFTFSNEEAEKIRNWIASGNIFRGLPFKIDTYNVNQSKLSYDGFINCANNIEIFEDTTIKANIQKAEGLNTLADRLEGLTLEYLYSINAINNGDFSKLKYVVEKNSNVQDIVASIIMAYILVTQLKAQVQAAAKAVANAVAHIAGGAPVPTAPIAGAAFAVAAAAIEVIYTVFMVGAVIKIGTDIFNMLVPIVREHKVLKLKTALTKISSYLGYSFNSNIGLLDKLHYFTKQYTNG